MSDLRQLTRVIDARPAADGDGVKIRRIAGQDLYRDMDPYLMLDEICSDDSADYIGGFPSHPHRGFETITYMLDGVMRHRDHMGNEGLLQSGGVQWMTAGRGVIHSEMPEQREGLLHGFQLWLNLPAAQKMQSPDYRDYRSEEFPVVELSSGGSVKVIAGEFSQGDRSVKGPVAREFTRPAYLDLTLPAQATFEWPVPEDQTVLVYVFAGELDNLSRGQMGVFTRGGLLSLLSGNDVVRALLLAGSPLREPVRQYGPFVMNTVDEIEQAIEDYNSGRLAG